MSYLKYQDELEPLKEECRHFLECCDTGQTPRTDAGEAMRVLDAMVRAESAVQ